MMTRHRSAGDDRRDGALRRPVRHRLGHHEQLHRHQQAQTTNLAVVAPGIAEALLATALGLVAAIPAVIIYNVFARSIAGYRQLLADASAERRAPGQPRPRLAARCRSSRRVCHAAAE